MNNLSLEQVVTAIQAVVEPKTPNIPISTMLQEAEDLHVWCQEDKAALVAAGLDWNLVDSLPFRASALRRYQSEWNKEYQMQEEAEKEWMNVSPAAYELRDELVHHCLFAFRNQPDLLAKVQQIAAGGGHADMIQDLSDLSLLGAANPEPLNTISVDLNLFITAGDMAEEMADVLARSNGQKNSAKEGRILRDKAYTYLKGAVDEIRRCGQYVFWRTNDRKKGYISRYWYIREKKAEAK